jgi:hypothetical protein
MKQEGKAGDPRGERREKVKLDLITQTARAFDLAKEKKKV